MDKNKRIMAYVEGNSQLVGTMHRVLVDKKTGETLEVEQTLKFNYGSKHFWKCYRTEFLKIMDALKGSQFKVFAYIIKNTQASNNQFVCTYAKMAKDIGCSKRTISETLKILQKMKFIRQKQQGIWIINPNVLMKGNDAKRYNLYSEYLKARVIEKTEKEDGKDDSGKQDRHEEADEEDSRETSEKEHQNTNNTDGSNRETNIDESHLPEHSNEQKQDEKVSGGTPT